MADETLDELNRLASSASLPAGTLLFRRSEPCGCVYIVRSGKVALLWPDEEAAPMDVRGPGSLIGLPAAINGAYSVTARAATDSELGIISADRVLELLASDPALCGAAMRMMSQEVARMRSSIVEHCTHID